MDDPRKTRIGEVEEVPRTGDHTPADGANAAITHVHNYHGPVNNVGTAVNAVFGDNYGSINQTAQTPSTSLASNRDTTGRAPHHAPPSPSVGLVVTHTRSLLALLNPILDASHTRNRKRSPPNSECFEGTREKVIEKINSWIDRSLLFNNPHIMWIYGFAGCGKSAIAQAVAELMAHQGRLAASFFFFRGSGERSTLERFAATVASQLAAAIPATAPIIRAAIDATPGLTSTTTAELSAQFQHLVYDPINEVKWDQFASTLRRGPYLIILDGVDECEDRVGVSTFIERMIDYFNKKPHTPLRILITSRVESHLHQRLYSSKQVKLLDLVRHTSDDDISAALDLAISKEKAHRILACEPSWPSPEDRSRLIKHIGRSYIFMTTIIKLLFDPEYTDGLAPMDRLPLVLATRPDFDVLYRTILSPWTNLPHFQHILCAVALSEMPLSITQIADMLDIRTIDVTCVLINLHAIMQIPGDDHTPVTLWHTSLLDFLRSRDRAGPFFANPTYHLRLAFGYTSVSKKRPTSLSDSSWFKEYLRRYGRGHILKCADWIVDRASCVFDEELGDVVGVLNEPYFDGVTALRVATLARNWVLVKCLVNAGADVNAKSKGADPRGNPILHLMYRPGYAPPDMICFLLEKGANPNAFGTTDFIGQTLLHLTCGRGDTKATEHLLNYNADPNVTNMNGNIPLHYACRGGNEGALELLLDHNADLNTQNRDGNTPLHNACRSSERGVELLLKRNANPNIRNKDGNTPLHIACRWSSDRMVELLLNCNADPTMRNNNGDTPLHLVYARWGHGAMKQLMLNHGADPP